MSISERERQALDTIGDSLTHSAPKLTSMLAMFARLTADEAMPARDQVQPGFPRHPGRPATAAKRVRRRWILRLHFGGEVWRWLWIVVALAALALTLVLNHGTGVGTCRPSRAAACGHTPSPGVGAPGGGSAGAGSAGATGRSGLGK